MEKLKLTPDEEKTAHLRSIAEKASSFDDAVRAFQREGMSQGRAIDAVAAHKPEAYNRWCKAGRPDIEFAGR